MLSDKQIIRFIFGFKVRHLRLMNKLSYQELYNATGLSTSYLSDIEKGKRYPQPDKINKLAAALGVDYNYMVSTNVSKKIQPIIDLINSNFLKLFPLQEFGINMEKLLALFSQTPDKVNAFISTVFKIARNYQVDERAFYLEALRSYQDMYNNHFPELEAAARAFEQEYSIESDTPYTTEFLEEQLEELYDIKVNREQLPGNKRLREVRSYYSKDKKVLYLQRNLTGAQQRFLIARELGFQYLQLEERPYETTIIHIASFEMLLNNYKASHFASALLMDAEVLVADLKAIARENTWSPDLILDLLKKYKVTPEMLFQRYTNILPHHFGLEDLFFIRLTFDEDDSNIEMSKDLHLSQLHTPYNNSLKEHFCRRWMSYKTIKLALDQQQDHVVADVQVSEFWESGKTYLCLSLATQRRNDATSGKSVTIGLLVNEKLRSIFHFLSDPAVPRLVVNTTCERCSVVDCQERAAPPTVIAEQERVQGVMEELGRF